MTSGLAQPVRVLVVDDQQLVRDGLASLLSIQEDIEVADTAANGEEALDKALKLLPDIILMDIRMPIMDGITATGLIRQKIPACQVLMLTTFDDEEYIVKALLTGACGYLLKDIPAGQLAQAVRLAHQGLFQIDAGVAGKIVGTLTNNLPIFSQGCPDELSGQSINISSRAKRVEKDINYLTEREREVLRLIASGATNREIAEKLFISEGTVKNHVSSILNCLGLRDRTQAAIYAHENGLK